MWDDGYDLEDVDAATRGEVFATGYSGAGDDELGAGVGVLGGFEVEGADAEGEFVGVEGVAEGWGISFVGF